MWSGLFVAAFVLVVMALAVVTVCYFAAVAQAQSALKQLHAESRAHEFTTHRLREAKLALAERALRNNH